MDLYRVIENNQSLYVIEKNGVQVMSAKRKSGFFGDTVTFYDSTGDVFLISKQTHISLFDFGHKLEFKKHPFSGYIRSNKLRLKNLEDGSLSLYSVVSRKLKLNNTIVGSISIKWKSSLWIDYDQGTIKEIKCEEPKAGLYFAIIDVVEDWFYFN